MMSKRNPWRGLAAYTEPKSTDKYSYKFCGRERETKELSYLVSNNLCVTMYGATGIGKTSLLQAGVFPILRKEGYIPIIVRPSTIDNDDDKSFAEIVVTKIETEITDIRSIGIELNNDLDYLWQYFATRRFYNDGNEVFPLIILDQFEENFFLNKEKTSYFLEQLYSLNNDNKIFPEGYHDETNFRFLISIREDALYCLEDCIDQFYLEDLKKNRYRLTCPDDNGIRDIIEKPGGDYLPKKEKDREKVISDIVNLVKKANGGALNTLVLSLICSLLYDKVVKRNRKCITVDDVLQLGTNPLDDYYCSLQLSKKQRKYIERKFVDDNGRRNSVNEELVDKEMPEWKNYCDGENRILQFSNGKVELIHDMLAVAIYNERNKQRSKRNKLLLELLVLVLSIVLFFFTIMRDLFFVEEMIIDIEQERVFLKGKYLHINIEDNQKIKNIEIVGIDTGEINIKIRNCPLLESVNISSNANRVSVYDCRSLKNLKFNNENIKELSLIDCDDLHYIRLQEYLENFTAVRTGIERINTGKNKSFFWEKNSEVLWNKRGTIGYISFVRGPIRDYDSVMFPYEFHTQDYARTSGFITVYNKGIWIDNILFDTDTTTIYDSRSPIDSVLDLTKYKKLESIYSRSFEGIKELRKIVIGGDKLDYISSCAFLNCGIDTVIFDRLPNLIFKEYINGNGIIANNDKKIVYIINKNNGGIYKKGKNGVVYCRNGEEKEPVLLSKEYEANFYKTSNYFIFKSPIGDVRGRIEGENIVYEEKWFKDFYLQRINRQEIRSTLFAHRAILSVFDEIKINLREFDKYKYEGLGFAWENKYYSRKLAIDFSSVSSKLKEIVFFNPIGYKIEFFNFPDSIKENTVLIVPYGQKELFENNPNCYGFKEIKECNIFLDFYYNVKELFYRTFCINLYGLQWLFSIFFFAVVFCSYRFYFLLRDFKSGSMLKIKMRSIWFALKISFLSAIMHNAFFWFFYIILDVGGVSFTIAFFVTLFILHIIYKDEVIYYERVILKDRRKKLYSRIGLCWSRVMRCIKK